MSAQQKIKNILDEWDPIDVLSFSPDEYLPIAEEIADTVTPEYTLISVFHVVRRAFRIYGVDFRKSREECMAIAEKIMETISK